MKTFFDWLDNRTGFRQVLHEALYERIPGGARWRYVWGSTLVFTFFVQMVTGFFLWTAYSPSAQTAWESVYYIQHVMQYGWLVRGLHHYAAQAMVVLLALHLMQVIVDGAYKAPREINFWLGLILMKIVLGLSLTGYLLPWDQKGYWATQVATNIAGLTPVVGQQVQELAAGGSDYGHHTLTRFFALHAGLLPFLLMVFVGLHLAVFRRHGITAPDPHHAPDAFFWPDQVLKDAVACLAVLATILLLTIYRGAELGAPADPSEAFSAARPEWYFLFLFQFLKLFPGSLEVIGAIVIPGILVLILFLMPILGYKKWGHTFNLRFMYFSIFAIAGLTAWAMISDTYYDPDYKWAVEEAHVQAERVRELAQAPEGIGPEGAIALLRRDPKLQGPKLFAKNCAACHRYNGEDGAGREVLATDETTGKKIPVAATASDLGNFGTREWARSVITNFPEHFKVTENDASIGDHFTKGAMAEWSRTNGSLLTKEEVDALVEFLVAQAENPKLEPALNPELIEKGLEIFDIGTDAVTESCASCHAMKPVGKDDPLEGGGNGPSLTGYGSQKWLNDFIANPGHKDNYGKRNRMPQFSKSMSAAEIDLVSRWMRGDWYEPHSGSTP